MKNTLKKVLVLAIVAIILVMPASTVLAETIPVTISYWPGGGSATYQYQPSPYVLHGGYGMMLHNYGNPTQMWNVNAGNRVIFWLDTKWVGRPSSGKLIVVDTSNGSTVASTEFTTAEDYYGISITLPALSTDKNYVMYLHASTDIFVDGYLYVWY